MLRTILSAWTWTAIGLLIVGWIPAMALARLFDRDPGRYRTGRMFRRLGSGMVTVNPAWRVRISGRLPDDPRTPFVVVCNHQSLADIPFISRLPWDMKWIGKASLFRLPVLGWMMRLARDLPVERGDRRSRIDVMLQARERLEQRVSVMIFPEGTRTRDGRVGRFSEGAFRLAIATGCPVLPLAIDGSFDALPKGGWRLGPPCDVRLHVFDPVETGGLAPADAPDLCARVRSGILERLSAWRGQDARDVNGAA